MPPGYVYKKILWYTKVMNSILSKIIKKMFDTNFIWLCQMAAVFNFIHNKMLNYPLVAQLDLAYLENRRHTSKSWSSYYFIEIYPFIVLILIKWQQF